MTFFKEFIFSVFATVGFSILFNVPKKSIFYAGITGGIGWVIYSYYSELFNTTFASFVASVLIGILGELFARIDKKPVTIFVIPGIVPIVPGYGTYLSMVNLINGKYRQALDVGIETISMAGAISMGIIIVASISKILKKNQFKDSR